MKEKKVSKNLHIPKKYITFAPLLKSEAVTFDVRRDGRVVDYNGLENRRAERHRGFESLSLRSIKLKPAENQRVFVFLKLKGTPEYLRLFNTEY